MKDETEYRAQLREKRKTWFDKAMTNAGVDSYGRASRIARDLKCSIASAQGWITGNLPKDGVLLYKAAKMYGFSMAEWVTTESQPASNFNTDEHWLEAIKTAKKFEEENGKLSPDAFQSVVVIIKKHLTGDVDVNDSLSAYQAVLNQARQIVNGE